MTGELFAEITVKIRGLRDTPNVLSRMGKTPSFGESQNSVGAITMSHRKALLDSRDEEIKHLVKLRDVLTSSVAHNPLIPASLATARITKAADENLAQAKPHKLTMPS